MTILIAALDVELVKQITPLLKENEQLLNRWSSIQKKIDQKEDIDDDDKDIKLQSNIDGQLLEVEYTIANIIQEKAKVKLSFEGKTSDAYAFERSWERLGEKQPQGLFHHLDDILIEPSRLTSLYDDYQQFMNSITLDEYIDEDLEIEGDISTEVYKTVFRRFNHVIDYCIKFNQTLFCMRVGEV